MQSKAKLFKDQLCKRPKAFKSIEDWEYQHIFPCALHNCITFLDFMILCMPVFCYFLKIKPDYQVLVTFWALKKKNDSKVVGQLSTNKASSSIV